MLRWTRPSTAARRARSWKVRRIAFGVTFLPRERCWQTSLNGLSSTVGLRKLLRGFGHPQQASPPAVERDEVRGRRRRGHTRRNPRRECRPSFGSSRVVKSFETPVDNWDGWTSSPPLFAILSLTCERFVGAATLRRRPPCWTRGTADRSSSTHATARPGWSRAFEEGCTGTFNPRGPAAPIAVGGVLDACRTDRAPGLGEPGIAKHAYRPSER